MAEIHAVSKERHATQFWKPYTSYAFASKDTITPLVAQELPRAAMVLPVAFVQHEDAFVLAAVQGFIPGRNLLVDADGRWLATYVPAGYRGYPFALAVNEQGEQVLSIREDEGVLSSTEGERFFGDDGQPSKRVQGVLDFLSQFAANRTFTQRVCALLEKHELIQPWPINVKAGEREKAVQGLFRIDEAALNALPGEAYLELREAGALPLAFCQLLSMQHLSKLAELGKTLANQQTTVPAAGDLDLEFLHDGGTISFGDS